jgi:hypothetical protein
MAYYKVGEIRRSDKGYSFDLLSGEGVPLVHFLYEREADALNALKQIRIAVASARLVTPLLA